MTDIIQDAKRLLDDTSPVLEMAQSIAEETWEYSAQEKRGEDWETFTNSETHIEEWWADKDDAEWAAIISQEQGHETRIVRRRVSPPEVINE